MRFSLFFLLLLILSACQEANLQSNSASLDRSLPDETSVNIRLCEYKHERLDYIIEAAKMERFTERRLLYGYKVKLTAYDKNGKISSVIQADTTIVDDARNIIFANGNAKFNSPGGNIKAQKMVWERNLDEITAPGKVMLTREGSTLWGNNLRTDGKLSFAEMDAVSAEGIVDEKDLDW